MTRCVINLLRRTTLHGGTLMASNLSDITERHKDDCNIS